MSNELKPCPFCGDEANQYDSNGQPMDDWAQCYCSALDGRSVHVSYWNTRPIEDALRANVEELRKDMALASLAVSTACVWFGPVSNNGVCPICRGSVDEDTGNGHVDGCPYLHFAAWDFSMSQKNKKAGGEMSLTDEQCRVMETWANTTMCAENMQLHMLNTIQEKKIKLLEADNAKLKAEVRSTEERRMGERFEHNLLQLECSEIRARVEAAEEVLNTVDNWRKLGTEITWDDVVAAYAKWESLK